MARTTGPLPWVAAGRDLRVLVDLAVVVVAVAAPGVLVGRAVLLRGLAAGRHLLGSDIVDRHSGYLSHVLLNDCGSVYAAYGLKVLGLAGLGELQGEGRQKTDCCYGSAPGGKRWEVL